MRSADQFPDEVLAKIRADRILGRRAGRHSTHCVIGVWDVVVEYEAAQLLPFSDNEL